MKRQTKKHIFIFSLILLLAFLGAAVFNWHRKSARADEIQPLIDAVTKQISENQAIANQKSAEADTLSNYLAAAQADLKATQGNLDVTRLKLKQIRQQQADNQTKLSEQEDLLGQNITSFYKNGSMSALEVLASSANLSEFVGRQEYYSSMRQKIDGTIKSIRDTRKTLVTLGEQLAIREQEEQLATKSISKKQADIQEVLDKTHGEEQLYQTLVSSDKQKLEVLRAQQAAAIMAQSAGRDYSLTSEYPWASADPFPSMGVDPWGFYYRQCTSYAAWRRAQLGRPIQAWGFLGPANARDWPNWAKIFSMQVDNKPEVGAIGVYPAGEYGHVMIVEGVVNNGQSVVVSEFNANWDGRYSQSIWPASSLVFIH